MGVSSGSLDAGTVTRARLSTSESTRLDGRFGLSASESTRLDGRFGSGASDLVFTLGGGGGITCQGGGPDGGRGPTTCLHSFKDGRPLGEEELAAPFGVAPRSEELPAPPVSAASSTSSE